MILARLLVALAALCVAGAVTAQQQPLRVVTTTTDLKNLVEAVAGRRVEAVSLVSPSIDAEEYQPIQVATSLAWKMPFVVRTMLGTDFHGVGFTVTYQKFADGLWFPVTYGGEFDIKGLFLYRRTMTINMVNSDFRRTDVQSNVAYVVEDK